MIHYDTRCNRNDIMWMIEITTRWHNDTDGRDEWNEMNEMRVKGIEWTQWWTCPTARGGDEIWSAPPGAEFCRSLLMIDDVIQDKLSITRHYFAGFSFHLRFIYYLTAFRGLFAPDDMCQFDTLSIHLEISDYSSYSVTGHSPTCLACSLDLFNGMAHFVSFWHSECLKHSLIIVLC